MKIILSLLIGVLFFLVSPFPGFTQEEMALYPGEIPNSKNAADSEYVENNGDAAYKISKPTLRIFLPEKKKANSAAVIICPGGGYGMLVMEREGYDVARRFNEKGIAAIVLKYRLPDARTMKDQSIGPLQDAQQAIKMVRENAAKWNIDPEKVGIMGFSAGGHLASTAGTHFQKPFIKNKKKINLRPDFMILVYPVISMQDRLTHSGSRKNLIGENSSQEKKDLFSNEKQVTEETPPVFLTHAADDTVVPVENSLLFYQALRDHGIPSSLHIYEKGEHGYIENPPRDLWMNDLFQWMKTNDWMK